MKRVDAGSQRVEVVAERIPGLAGREIVQRLLDPAEALVQASDLDLSLIDAGLESLESLLDEHVLVVEMEKALRETVDLARDFVEARVVLRETDVEAGEPAVEIGEEPPLELLEHCT
jgi:hypothetical protein